MKSIHLPWQIYFRSITRSVWFGNELTCSLNPFKVHRVKSKIGHHCDGQNLFFQLSFLSSQKPRHFMYITWINNHCTPQKHQRGAAMIKHVTIATHIKSAMDGILRENSVCRKNIFSVVLLLQLCNLHRKYYYTIKQSTYGISIRKGKNWATIKHIAMATQSLKCDGRKNGKVDSVLRTYKLRCFSNMPIRDHAVFACHDSTLAVNSENPFMMSNLTTGNSGQLKMSPNSVRRKNGGFGFGPTSLLCHILVILIYHT